MIQKIAEYKIIKLIQPNGENANVYLVEDEDSKKFIIKEFNKRVQPYVGLSKNNHYGRRREGAEIVFNEIDKISQKNKFLIRFYKRFKYNNKWCILLEYIEGETLGNFLRKNNENKSKIINIVEKFATEIRDWHNNGFAHGDPHLENVIVENENSIKLIDYGQLHHQSFSCCQRFKCFNNNIDRFSEDLINKSGKLGQGFITEIEKLENELNLKKILSETFKNKYYR
jgi:serine/threonine protein kinase